MRRALVLNTLLVVVAAPAALMVSASEAGAAPVRSAYDALDLNCEALTSPGGTAFLQVSTRPDGGAFTTVWRPGDDPLTDDPWLSGAGEQVTTAGSSVTAGIPLLDLENGNDHGTALVDALVTPSGQASTSTSTSRQGNVRNRTTTTTTPGEVAGSLTVPGAGVFALENCVAEISNVESFTTNPAAYVENLAAHVAVECTFEDTDGDVHLQVEGLMRGDRGSMEVSIWEDRDGSEEPVLFGDGLATLTRTTLSATADLTDTSGTPLGTATVDARVSVVDRHRARVSDGPATSTVRAEHLRLDGLLSLPDGRSFALEGCSAVREQGQQRLHP